jgi:hypothetical protein
MPFFGDMLRGWLEEAAHETQPFREYGVFNGSGELRHHSEAGGLLQTFAFAPNALACK